jgi:hypothetical protein
MFNQAKGDWPMTRPKDPNQNVPIDPPNDNDEDDPSYQIFYCPITIKQPSANEISIEYAIVDPPNPKPKQTVGAFVQSIAGHFPTARPVVPTPLDIDITTPCHIVFYLNPAINWGFRRDIDALTTEQPVFHRYINLQFFDDAGGVIPSDSDLSQCPIIAVTATRRAEKLVHDGFNLNLIFTMITPSVPPVIKTLKTTFDPDINNSGGQGFIGQ